MVRRRGFGIHSPFAFDFVRRVIAQPCSFYCYTKLDAAARRNDVSPSLLRLIFRVALFFRPSEVSYLGACSPVVKVAVDFACPRPNKCDGARMVIASGSLEESELNVAMKCAQDGGTVMFLDLKSDASASSAVWAAAEHGMMFCGSDTAIYVGLHHLPRQSFNVWL